MQRRLGRWIPFTLAAAAITACGGGSGSTNSAATPAESPQAVVTTPSSIATTPSVLAPDCGMFPASAIFNTRVDDNARFPAHAKSNEWIERVGATTQWMPNWGNSSNPANTDNYWG